MKKSVVAMVFVLAMSVTGLAYAASITIDVPLPRIVITAPPELVVIPGTYVYLAPDVKADLFFMDGRWYRLHEGKWFSGAKYGGPWVILPGPKIPPALLKLPPGYRKLPPGHMRIKHNDAVKNWRKWKQDRHWDRPSPPPPSVVKPGPKPPPPVVVKPATAATKSEDKSKYKEKEKGKDKH